MESVESILADVSAQQGRGTDLERWLDGQNDKVQALFWDVMRAGRDRGLPFSHVLKAFMYKMDPEKKLNSQSSKRVVDAYLSIHG
jgi:hypothetical protein